MILSVREGREERCPSRPRNQLRSDRADLAEARILFALGAHGDQLLALNLGAHDELHLGTSMEEPGRALPPRRETDLQPPIVAEPRVLAALGAESDSPLTGRIGAHDELHSGTSWEGPGGTVPHGPVSCGSELHAEPRVFPAQGAHGDPGHGHRLGANDELHSESSGPARADRGEGSLGRAVGQRVGWNSRVPLALGRARNASNTLLAYRNEVKIGSPSTKDIAQNK